ncbi:MAG: helix-turn-helix domain-containing protein [Acidobacteriota bacterium]
MSQTLGEKLRQAREEKGISVAEVAEQTRISPHYIESIERDDYKPLPGGIFNKGFVKSFAKYVNIDEQQALTDYSSLISSSQPLDEPDGRTYRPEVLTDDRGGRSMVPTVIMAVIILAVMTVGILFLINYLENRGTSQTASVPANSTVNTQNPTVTNTPSTTAGVPELSAVKIEFKALGSPVSLAATTDSKFTNSLVAAGSSMSFEPKENLKLSYSRSLANEVQITINGKAITPPAQPLSPKRNIIEFEINKSNLAQIWQSGSITGDPTLQAPSANTDPSPAATTVRRPTPAAKPVQAANSAAANTNKPLIKSNPTPKPTIIAVPPVTKPKP